MFICWWKTGWTEDLYCAWFRAKWLLKKTWNQGKHLTCYRHVDDNINWRQQQSQIVTNIDSTEINSSYLIILKEFLFILFKAKFIKLMTIPQACHTLNQRPGFTDSFGHRPTIFEIKSRISIIPWILDKEWNCVLFVQQCFQCFIWINLNVIRVIKKSISW